MISLPRLGVLLWAATLCPAPGVVSVAQAHDDRIPRESREIHEERSGERETEDRSGSGSRDGGTRDGGGHDDSRSGESGRDSGSGGDSGRRADERRAERRREPRVEFERDGHGGERVRGEVLVVGSHDDVVALRAAGYTLLEVAPLSALDAEAARVRVPDGHSLDAMVDELRSLLPRASVAADHLFRPSGSSGGATAPAPAPQAPDTTAIVGIVDTGIDAATPALRTGLRETRGFAAGGYVPRAHGTAVGDIVARAGVSLRSADAFGIDSEANLAATTLALAQSIDWLLSRGTRVINISITGPDNPIVARVIRKALDYGCAVVAAAGNAGPSAPPAFPAAYPGVIAVTAVDERGRVYRRANRGAYITFAARGVNVATPRPGGGMARESGTSFAAPLVSAAFALRALDNPGEPLAQGIAALARGARDLGTAGRDDVYGWGEVELPRRQAAQGR